MKLADIITNTRITCEQSNIEFKDFLIGCVIHELGLLYDTTPIEPLVEQFENDLKCEYDLLGDLQLSLKEDEYHALAVQHATDIYDVLLGRF